MANEARWLSKNGFKSSPNHSKIKCEWQRTGGFGSGLFCFVVHKFIWLLAF